MIRWFGSRWNGPADGAGEKIATPWGAPCERCRLPIMNGDSGLLVPAWGSLTGAYEGAYHLGCFLVAVGARKAAEESPAA